MRGTRRNHDVLRVLVFALILNTSSLLCRTAHSEESAPENPRFALLIGVGKYPNLGASEQLDGSANDVAAMRELLTGRFGFQPQHVTTLVDEQATGDGIRMAMQALVATIGDLPAGSPPAQVLVHFSGHGSQVPDQADGPDRDEDDGLDETWVPHDATKQGGNEDIRDDKINQLVRGICADGKAQLLIVFDCCHSGTGARGITKNRQLSRDLEPTQSDAPVTPKRLPPGAVFLSACRAREKEPEFQDGDKSYGLLTRFLVQTLSEERVVSGLSYDLLQKAIVANYLRDPAVMQAPVPQLEGDPAALKKPILGFGPDVDLPPYYTVDAASSESVLLRAGKFHNVTAGSLLELYDRPELIVSNEPSLGWLRVTEVEGTTSTARAIGWVDGERTEPVDASLPKSFKKGFAVLRYREPDDTGLRLKVVRVTGENSDSAALGPGDAAVPRIIADLLAGVETQGEAPWLHWITEQDEPCDMVLRIDGDYASLFPATGVAEVAEAVGKSGGDVPASLRGGWGPIDLRTGKDTAEEPQSLPDYLRRITKARNLISLAQSGADGGASDYLVELELMAVTMNDGLDEIISIIPWEERQESVLAMEEEQLYAFRVTNSAEDSKPVYITLLEISPDMGIQHVMPDDDPVLKLEPGEQRTSYVLKCVAPHGAYQAVMLATREKADFRFVAQADLPKTRGGANALEDRLAEVTHFHPPKTRGRRLTRKKSADTSWHGKVISWRTKE